MTSTTRLIDDGMITYAGLPGPTICDFWSRIVEHMTNLGALPPRGFRFTAAPPKIVGMGSFAVRAFGVVE